MARLGAALVGAGDGLRRIDTGDWQGEAADSFRRVFEPVPPQWIGTGEAFLQAADALAEYADVLEGARDDAALAVREWETARSQRPAAPRRRPDPARPAVAALDRLRAARTEVLAAGDRAATLVGHARDLAPPAPSVAQQLGGFLGDLAGGAWSELSATGQFLWQVNPTRFLVEPAAAVQGWEDLGTGVAHAVTHPRRPSRRRSTRARRPPTPPAGPARCSPARDSPPSAVPAPPDGSNAPPARPGRCRPAHQRTAATRPHPSGATTA